MCSEKLPYFPKCFVCGQDNPIGLKMVFEYDEKNDSIKSRVTFTDDHVGYEDIIHGGLAVTVMDETMAWMAIKKTGLMCLTEGLKVTFSKALRSNSEYSVEASVDSLDSDKIRVHSSIRDSEKNLCASAEGQFSIMKGRRSSMMKDRMKKH